MIPEPIEIVDYSFQQRIFKMYLYPLPQIPPGFAESLCDFYALWNDLRKGDNIPLRKDINFEVLQGWHANIRLVDLGVDKLSPKRNIILGEIYKQYWGTDTMYSRFIDDDDTSKQNKENYIKSITCFMDYNYAISIGMAPNESGSHQKIAWIDLPLSNTDDNKITHILTALIPIKETD